MKSDATVTHTEKKLSVSSATFNAFAENLVARRSPEDAHSTLLLFTLSFSFNKIIHSQRTFFFSKDAEPAEGDKRMSVSYWDAKM